MTPGEHYTGKRTNFIAKTYAHFAFLTVEFGYDSPIHTEGIQPNGVVISDQIEYRNSVANRVIHITNAYHPVDYGFTIEFTDPTRSTHHTDREMVKLVMKEDQDQEQSYLEQAAKELRANFEAQIRGTAWFGVKEGHNTIPKNTLDDFVPDWVESDRLHSTTTEVLEYNIIDKVIDKVSIDAFVYLDTLTWREYPPAKTVFEDLVFEREAAITDVISVSISADGMMVSKRLKELLEKFNLGDHRFYPVTIVDPNTKREYVYFWLHFIFDETRQDYIDFPNSTFVLEEILDGERTLKGERSFDNVADYTQFIHDRHEQWLENSDTVPYTEVKIKHLQLKRPTPDIIGFGRVDGDLYCTRPLREALERNGITGISFKGTQRITFASTIAANRQATVAALKAAHGPQRFRIIKAVGYAVLNIGLILLGVLLAYKNTWTTGSGVILGGIGFLLVLGCSGILAMVITKLVLPTDPLFDSNDWKTFKANVGAPKARRVLALFIVLFLFSFSGAVSLYIQVTRTHQFTQLRNFGQTQKVRIKDIDYKGKGTPYAFFDYYSNGATYSQTLDPRNYEIGDSAVIIFSVMDPDIVMWADEFEKEQR